MKGKMILLALLLSAAVCCPAFAVDGACSTCGPAPAACGPACGGCDTCRHCDLFAGLRGLFPCGRCAVSCDTCAPAACAAPVCAPEPAACESCGTCGIARGCGPVAHIKARLACRPLLPRLGCGAACDTCAPAACEAPACAPACDTCGVCRPRIRPIRGLLNVLDNLFVCGPPCGCGCGSACGECSTCGQPASSCGCGGGAEPAPMAAPEAAPAEQPAPLPKAPKADKAAMLHGRSIYQSSAMND